MQKKLPKIYCFVNDFNLSELSKLSKDISIIYRNYDDINHLDNILKLKKFCKRSKNKFYLSNNIRLSIKLGLNGVYIPSFNKKINYVGTYSLPKSFKIIGSAHSFNQIIIKQKQKCDEVFLSPIFKVNKSKKFLNISKFNLMAMNGKIDCIALGGINQKNYKKIKLLKSKGFASISWAKKNGLRKLRPF
jgi:thiamine-phosphate pyrophosphorylase|tara:strand:- start:8987 stop:9553 length:567 start_codon:yes stop_codon:yes gene_type:complete